ncbi:MAG: hypothetical protein ACKO3W_05640 [bacterium]
MASKSFYTLEEAAKRLGWSADKVNRTAEEGKLTRVSHEGQPKFRVEEVEILAMKGDSGGSSAGGFGLLDDSGGGAIGLADSGPGMKSPASGGAGSKAPASLLDDSVLGLADSTPKGAKAQGAGIDLSDQTGVSALSGRRKGGDGVEIGLETVGSGSGLLELTRESEETALGAELLDQVYSNESDSPQVSADVFGAVAADASLGQMTPSGSTGMVAVETVDGAWSGVGTGVLIAAFAGIVVCGLIAVSVAMGAGSAVASAFSGNILAWAGSLAGITAVFGLVGFFVGRATE